MGTKPHASQIQAVAEGFPHLYDELTEVHRFLNDEVDGRVLKDIFATKADMDVAELVEGVYLVVVDESNHDSPTLYSVDSEGTPTILGGEKPQATEEKVMVFVVPFVSTQGAQDVELYFPYDGTITQIDAVISSSNTTEIDTVIGVENATEGGWVEVGELTILAGETKATLAELTHAITPSSFRLNIKSDSTGVKGLNTNIRVNLY